MRTMAHQQDVYNVFGGVRVFVSIVGPLSFSTFPRGCLTLVLLG